MPKKIAALFFLLVLACSAVPQTSEAKSDADQISLSVKDIPLGEVLKSIAEMSGYTVTINAEYANLPVSTSFKGLTLHQALRRVLGAHNRYVLINETTRNITLNFTGFPAGPTDDSDPSSSSKAGKKFEATVPPDTYGDISVSAGDEEKTRKIRPRADFDESEPAPDDMPDPGRIGVRNAAKKIYNADSLEVIPPNQPGEKGLTLKDIEKLRRQKQ